MNSLVRNYSKSSLTAGLLIVATAGLVCSTPVPVLERQGDVEPPHPNQQETTEHYSCKWHPEIREPQSGECPVCQKEMVAGVELRETREGESGAPDEIREEGMSFDPPLELEELPEDQEYWYCDLGTVEWAQAKPDEEGCPICGLSLVYHKPADDSGESGECGQPGSEAEGK